MRSNWLISSNWLIKGLVLAFVAFCLLCIGLGFIVEVPLVLAFGWIYFLVRTLPKVQPDWSSIGLAGITLALLVIGIQGVGRRWANGWAAIPDDRLHAVTADGIPRVEWKARWTAFLTVALLIIFVAGISVVGVVHQAAWMMTSDDPVIDNNSFEFSGRLTSRNHLKLIGSGLHNYSDTHGSLPSGGTFDTNGRGLHSAMTMILPFVEQLALFERIDLQQPWNDVRNGDVFRTVVPAYQFPTIVPNPEVAVNRANADAFSLSNYSGNIHVLRLGRAIQISSISDGTTNTILFGEVNKNLRPWGDPLNVRDPATGINRGPNSFGSPFSRGANILMADGSVRFVSDSITPEVLRAISTPDSGELAVEF